MPVTKVYSRWDSGNLVFHDGAGTDLFSIGSDGSVDIKVTGKFKLGGTAVTATAAELNKLDGLTALVGDLNLLAGLVAASQGILKVYEEEVDCSGGGTAQEQALVTLPAGSVLLEVVTTCTEAFDGDTTKTFEVGVSGNTDKYVDPVDCPVTLNDTMAMAGGTNNDQKNAEGLNAETSLIATWTNTGSASAGKVKVRVIYF